METVSVPAATEAPPEVERRIARRLAQLRADSRRSLEDLSKLTGISRPTLSRIERSELSPTASMLGTLCSVYGWTLSRLMADVETSSPSLVQPDAQLHWTDPASGYRRRAISPPAPGLRGELVEVQLPADATVAFEAAPVIGLEHHLWMLDGSLVLSIDGASFPLRRGDCLRYTLFGPTRFEAGRRGARYLVAMVRP